MDILPSLPQSWSQLTWQQLTAAWTAKMRYGGNADVARAAALLVMALGYKLQVSSFNFDEGTGETVFTLLGDDGQTWTTTARELAHMSKQALPWFDFPYGDPGDPAVKDEKGKVVKEARDPVRGYVGPMRDALALTCDYVRVKKSGGVVNGSSRVFRFLKPVKTFALPQVACNNLTWQQYRSLQAIVPQLFRDDITDDEAASLQAQFLAHCLVPRSLALMDSSGRSLKLRPHWVYEYDADRAERLVGFWERKLMIKRSGLAVKGWLRRKENHEPLSMDHESNSVRTLFHICFQAYQTAITYYATSYPLLFQDSGKKDPLRDALTGEVGTINTIMKYAGYAEQQQVYDSNLPFVLDILNTMTKEAHEIEKMNAKIKRK